MTAPETNENSRLEKRIRKLEWSARLSWYLTFVLLIVVGLGAYRVLQTPTTFLDRHGNFQLVDERQQAQVYLYRGPSSSGMKLYDHLNEQRATLGTSVEGSALTLRDYQTHMRIMARVSASGPELLMADPDKNIRMALQVHDEGPRMLFYDAEGRVTFDTNEMVEPAANQVASTNEPKAAAQTAD